MKKIAFYASIFLSLVAFAGCSHLKPAGPATDPDLASMATSDLQKTTTAEKARKKEKVTPSAAAACSTFRPAK